MITFTLELTEQEHDYVFDAVLALHAMYVHNHTNSLTKKAKEVHSKNLDELANKLAGIKNDISETKSQGLRLVVDNTKKAG